MKNINELRAQNKLESERLTKIASRNNKGIELEKLNKIDEAIKYYEENVSDKVDATHSYDRLMIIYRKKKQYQDEVRIIKTAIEVFSHENEKRLKNALLKNSSNQKTEKIQEGFNKCENVRDNNGKIIFAPYPVKKYQNRLKKVVELINK